MERLIFTWNEPWYQICSDTDEVEGEGAFKKSDSLDKAVSDLGELLNYPMCDDMKLRRVEEVYYRIAAFAKEKGA